MSKTSSDYWTVVKLRVFNVQEILFGWCLPSVPSAGVIAPLDTSKVLGLLSVDRLLDHPVQPQALCWAADHAGDGGAASDLREETHTPRSGFELIKCNAPSRIIATICFKLLNALSFHLAVTAHGITLCQALLLGGTCGLPGLNKVAQCDVHCPVSLQFACSGRTVCTRQ